MKLIKVLAVAVSFFLLVVSMSGWLTALQAHGYTDSGLNHTWAEITSLEPELLKTQDSLLETRYGLRNTAASLSSTQSEFTEQVDETKEYIDLDEEMSDHPVETGLYKDTLDITVYSGVVPPYRSGNTVNIVLTDNTLARNPTWDELKTFLREDKTDKLIYKPGEFECGNFAMQLHDNAEAAGIRSAFVAVLFYDDIPHAVNAFQTVDRGLVYIDVTGSTQSSPIPFLDTEVTLVKDEIMERSFIFPSQGYFWPSGQEIVAAIEIYW